MFAAKHILTTTYIENLHQRDSDFIRILQMNPSVIWYSIGVTGLHSSYYRFFYIQKTKGILP